MNKEFEFDLQLFADSIPTSSSDRYTPVQPIDDNTHYYTEEDRDEVKNFGKLLEPGLRKIFFETYDEIPEQYSKIYNMLTSRKR